MVTIMMFEYVYFMDKLVILSDFVLGTVDFPVMYS